MSVNYLLTGGTVATAENVFSADLRIGDRRVLEIGEGMEAKRNEVRIDCSGQYIYPGLINSHDHLSFNLFPRLGDSPYANSYEWVTDIRSRHKATIETINLIPLRDRLFWGAWKNLFSGATTVIHHDPYYAHFRFQYPLDVLKRYTFAHSFDYEPDMHR